MLRYVRIFHIPIVCIFLAALSACTPAERQDTSPPDVEDYGIGPLTEVYYHPNIIDCTTVKEIAPGPRWNDLRIGVTTYQEMLAILGPDIHVEWDKYDANLQVYKVDFEKEEILDEFSACFNDGVLSALNLYSEEFPRTMEEVLSAYGQPDMVTYGVAYGEEIMIWAEKGLLIVIETDVDETINYMFFSPIPKEDLAESWLVESLPKEPPEPPPL